MKRGNAGSKGVFDSSGLDLLGVDRLGRRGLVWESVVADC